MKEILDVGYGVAACRQWGIEAAPMLEAGIIVETLLRAGYSAKQLRDAGVCLQKMVAAGVGTRTLRDLGFAARELLACGFSPGRVAGAGYSWLELQAAAKERCTWEEEYFGRQAAIDAIVHAVHDGKTLAHLRRNGLHPSDLKEAGLLTEFSG